MSICSKHNFQSNEIQTAVSSMHHTGMAGTSFTPVETPTSSLWLENGDHILYTGVAITIVISFWTLFYVTKEYRDRQKYQLFIFKEMQCDFGLELEADVKKAETLEGLKALIEKRISGINNEYADEASKISKTHRFSSVAPIRGSAMRSSAARESLRGSNRK